MDKDDLDFIEDYTSGVDGVNHNTDGFQIIGNKSKYDELGILDENIKIRQNLTRLAMSENILKDTDTLNVVLKMMNDNDKSIISQARLKLDEDNNKNQNDLIKAIVTEAMSIGDEYRKKMKISNNEAAVKRDITFNLPEPTRNISDDELVIGTVILTEEEVMDKLKN